MKYRFKKIYIEIINYCNLNCPFCVKTKKDKRMMSFDEFKHILDKIRPFTQYLYLHVQGEPLLHNDIEEFICLADEMGFKVNLTTNATLLEKHSNITKHLRQLNISLQALMFLDNKEKYLNDIIKVIKNNSKTYISLRLWGNFNESSIINYFENACETKVDLNVSNKLIENVFFSFDEEFEWPSLDSDFSDFSGSCQGTISHIAILCDGTVVPCCLDKDGIISLGNIYNQSLSEIIASKRFKNIYEGFRSQKITENLCSKCSYRYRFKK